MFTKENCKKIAQVIEQTRKDNAMIFLVPPDEPPKEIAEARDQGILYLGEKILTMLDEDNPDFDGVEFIHVCGGKDAEDA